MAEEMTTSSLSRKFYSEIVSLPKILRQLGYNTYFLSAHTNTSCHLNTMLKTLDFDYVFTPEDFGFTRCSKEELKGGTEQ